MRSASAFGIVMVVVGLGCGGGAASVKPGPMPDDGTFTGVFHSLQYGDMHMVQNGSAVVGKYKQDERAGTIQGEAEGNLLRFEWVEYKAMISNRPQETRGHGYFRYMIDPSNGDHLLKGRWGLNDSDTDGGEWTAYKMRSREPDLEHFAPDIPTGGGQKGAAASEGEEGGSEESGSGTSGGTSGGEESDDEF